MLRVKLVPKLQDQLIRLMSPIIKDDGQAKHFNAVRYLQVIAASHHVVRGKTRQPTNIYRSILHALVSQKAKHNRNIWHT